MPCIIDQNDADSKSPYNKWTALCGKCLTMHSNAFESPEKALESGEPICVKCRKLANLPPPAKKNNESTEPFTVYSVVLGVVKTKTATKETPTGFRVDNGELSLKTAPIGNLLSKRMGMGRTITTRDKAEAIELAREQIQAQRDYITQLQASNEQLGKDLENFINE
ncbi:hypothetical protein [Vibrio campbellii]|uniref:hypothetical protein n=1 Tax=Vibrio campbellii TaxID=680 RepID=UPI00210DEDC7|nr:hypothetical protein [Vibrio campbellii]UTZ44571.1 hypothetical protein HB764_25255 [Vibrio campbellii]